LSLPQFFAYGGVAFLRFVPPGEADLLNDQVDVTHNVRDDHGSAFGLVLIHDLRPRPKVEAEERLGLVEEPLGVESLGLDCKPRDLGPVGRQSVTGSSASTTRPVSCL